MRESAHSKGRRYLTEGRLTILEVTANRISALCKGDGRVYSVTYNGDWSCDCAAISRNCSHLLALRLVTLANPRAVGTDIRIGDGDASQFEGRRP